MESDVVKDQELLPTNCSSKSPNEMEKQDMLEESQSDDQKSDEGRVENDLLINEKSDSTQPSSDHLPIEHRVYPIRWLMLVTMIVLNISNGMMWLSYSPVPSLTAEFYHISLSDVDWFSQSYFVASLLVGFIAIAVLDIFGLRTSVFIGATLNLTGAILRYISALHPVVCSSLYSNSGFMVAMIGQILSACAQPFFLYAPTKLANTWFGPKERAICTNLASIANPVGIALAQIMSPHIAKETDKIPTMLWAYIVPAGVGAILAVVYYRDRPPVPPTASGDTKQEKFFKGLKKTAVNWNFLVLLVSWGVAAGMFNAFQIVIPQYLCPYGYSNQTVGIWGSIMIFCGLFGATVTGIVLDQTKWFKQIGVFNLTLALVSMIWFVEVATVENSPFLVAIPLCLFGFFGLAFLPVCMELGVEVTYPVAEATSSGLLWSAAQIFGIIFVSIGQLTVTNIPPNSLSYDRCELGLTGSSNHTYCGRNLTSLASGDSSKPQDWTNAGLMFAGATFVGYCLFVLFFQPTYKRLEVERADKKNERSST